MAKRATGNYLWQLDSDEFYHEEQLSRLMNILSTKRPDMVSFPMITFWGSPDYIVDGFYFIRDKHDQIPRLFAWGPGYTYVTHRPATVLDEQGIDLRKKFWLRARDLQRMQIYMYHYSLLFPHQLAAGDPRGTLIALQRKHGKKRAGKKEIADFIAQHAEELLGPLADYEDQLDLEWANGYLSDAKVFCKATRSGDGEQKSVDQILPTLLEHEKQPLPPHAEAGLARARPRLELRGGGRRAGRQRLAEPPEAPGGGRLLRVVGAVFSGRLRRPRVARRRDERGRRPDLRSVAQLAGKAKQLESLRVWGPTCGGWG